VELDPLGTDVGMSDPYVGAQQDTDQPYPRFGEPVNQFGGCSVDGVPAPCSYAAGLVNMGAGVQVFTRRTTQVRNGRVEILTAHYDGYAGFMGSGDQYRGNGVVFIPDNETTLVSTDLDKNIVTLRPGGGHFENLEGAGSLMGSVDFLPLRSGKATLTEYQRWGYDFFKRVAKKNLSACRDFLISKGFIFGDVDHALEFQKPYDGTRSTINVVKAGLVVAGSSFGRFNVQEFFQRYVNHAATAIRSVATRYDVYINPNSYGSLTLIHEALHSATRMDDVQLSHMLTGKKYDAFNIGNASADVSDALAAGGCGINANGQ
jgi:hypothetical protein